MKKQYHLTAEGLAELKAELASLEEQMAVYLKELGYE